MPPPLERGTRFAATASSGHDSGAAQRRDLRLVEVELAAEDLGDHDP
jgi:hypothetical protein